MREGNAMRRPGVVEAVRIISVVMLDVMLAIRPGRLGVDVMVVSWLSDANAAQHAALSIQPQHIAAPALRTVSWSHGP